MQPTATNCKQATGLTAFGLPRWWSAAVLMSLVWIGFRPFSDGAGAQGGDLANQVGFALLGLFAIHAATRMERRRRTALLQPGWLVVGFLLLASVIAADSPAAALRGVVFSAVVVLCAGVATALPRTLADLTGALVAAALAALAFSFVAVALFPAVGIHDGSGYEAQHAGLWRGVYAHKNVASYVAGAFVVVGLFAARNGRPLSGWITVALALLFVVEAGSKTVLGILPAAILVGWLAARFRCPVLRALALAAPLAALLGITLGAALHEGANALLQNIAPGMTFTGRLDLWRFAAEQIEKAPAFGYGFESFWTTPRALGQEQPIELSWDVRRIVHAHNSYLDAAITFGTVGAGALFAVVVARPLWHFATVPKGGNANRVAQMYATLWLFAALGGCLESFFLRRGDPVWFVMALSLFGLQVTHAMTRRSHP